MHKYAPNGADYVVDLSPLTPVVEGKNFVQIFLESTMPNISFICDKFFQRKIISQQTPPTLQEVTRSTERLTETPSTATLVFIVILLNIQLKQWQRLKTASIKPSYKILEKK